MGRLNHDNAALCTGNGPTNRDQIAFSVDDHDFQVLRGHAVILELDFKRPDPDRLKPKKIDGDFRYRKHLIPSRGLGVRDLCLDGDDMLVLLGTPLSSDGPARVLRWKEAVGIRESGVVGEEALSSEIELPYRGDRDHPEGIDLIDRNEKTAEGAAKKLLVAYDSPEDDRIREQPPGLTADIFHL